MQMMFRAALAAFAFATATPALAQTPSLPVDTCATPSTPATETADQAAVDAAIASFNTRGFAGIGPHLDALRTVMDHAPACYPWIERRSDSTLVRAADTQEFLILSAVVSAEPGAGNVIMTNNTYPLAALLLGSYDVEYQHYETAIAWLDRGLALQPHSAMLISERVSALLGARRFQEAYEATDAALREPALSLTLDRARFNRTAGVALIDLNRLDDAEASLNEALRLDPNDRVAREELLYIAELRRGGPQRDLLIEAPNAPQQVK